MEPTRLLCPWDFSGKNTGAGCHCLLEPASPPFASEFFTTEAPGKPQSEILLIMEYCHQQLYILPKCTELSIVEQEAFANRSLL